MKRRQYFYPDGAPADINEFYYDEEGLLRDSNQEYPCPHCMCQFSSKRDVSEHVAGWHRKGGRFFELERLPWFMRPSEPRHSLVKVKVEVKRIPLENILGF